MKKQAQTHQYLNVNFDNIPIEYIKWGLGADHFKIEMPHRHEFDELLFFIKGGGVHEINFAEQNIQDNSVHFIPSNTVHFLKRDLKSDGLTIAFSKQFLQNHPIHSINSPLPLQYSVLNLAQDQFQSLMYIVSILKNQVTKNKSYFVEKSFLTSLEFLLAEIMTYLPLDENLKTKKNVLLVNFELLINKHIREERHVYFYASKLYIAPKYLSNLTKKYFNKSAKSIIHDAFVNWIKKELAIPSNTNKIIAEECNVTESSLCNYFKKSVGYTMEEYKSQINKII